MPAASAQGHPRRAARSEKPVGSAGGQHSAGAEIAAAAPTRSYWVIPELVAEVRFTEWTRDRRRRHPVFLGLREDKKGPEVVLDPAVGTALDRTAGDKEVSALRPKHQTLRSK
jgi:ATP dependent DNA ligase C terminal region